MASRIPSPRKLKSKTAMTTAIPGYISQGCSRITVICCASRMSAPQLTIGGTMPNPKKLSAVSPYIMPGTLRAAVMVMWLAALGIIWMKMT